MNWNLAAPVLLKALENKDSYVRASAIEATRNLDEELAVPIIIKALEDRVRQVRINAVVVATTLNTKSAVLALLKALEDKDLSIRQIAARSLEKFSDKSAIPSLVRVLDDGNSNVRSSAAKALGEIGGKSAIPSLVRVLDDRNSNVRSSAVDALCQIHHPESIELIEMLAVKSAYIDAFLALAGIQNHCKFYCYKLTKTHIQGNGVSNSVERTSDRVRGLSSTFASYASSINILHLSDLHFGTSELATQWANQLATDLSTEISPSPSTLDALILSGDIANYSTAEEYTAAQSFLNSIQIEFGFSKEQIIIVPGNHDISWHITDPDKNDNSAYKLKRRNRCTAEELREGYFIAEGPNSVWARDKDLYKQRFHHFANFYQTIKGDPYPTDYADQFTIDILPEQNLLILGLNSAWNLDHHYTKRVSIHPEALSKALSTVRRNKDYADYQKIAVWHHPLESEYEDRIKDASFLEQLTTNGFRLFLHGHVHKAKNRHHPYDTERGIHCICAGTFGAPSRELETGTPWQYNLLRFEGDTLKVQTRKRESENGAWMADTRWKQGREKPDLDCYTIDLSQ